MEERVFGRRYRAIETIGSGGMADVYKAVDEVLGRTVAVKVLHPRYASDPGFVQRFRHEAASAANLSHPNIVNIYDWGQDGETYYIVMEYVRGSDLKSLVEDRGPFPPRRAAEYGAQVAAALSVAHGYDIIHRDIKPQNIVLTPDGTIKVMDFGIARAGNTNMTQTGSVLGTAQYVSPEQAQGRPLGPTSDLYSLGIVLYELSTGRLPFDGDTPVSVALKQVNEAPVPPRQIDPAIPAALEAVILKAMAKKPQERYQSAEEMRRDLLRVSQGESVDAMAVGTAVAAAVPATTVMPAARPPGTAKAGEAPAGRKTNPWPWIVAAIALLVVGGLITAWATGMFGPAKVPVPDLRGQTLAQAEAALAAEDLSLGAVEPAFSEEVEAGIVMDQSPSAGVELEKDSKVDLVVSKGIELLPVPDFVGMSESAAAKAAREAGFELDVPQRKASTTTKKGDVISQSPEAGAQAARGSLIELVVSEGPEFKQVPDVVGKSSSQAQKTLAQDGFKVKQGEDFSETVKKGVVISQSPDAPAIVTAGSTITIVISKGPDRVIVPDVTGMSEAAAKKELEDLGLKVTVNYQASPDEGFVLTQDPPHDAQVKRGDNVTIWVGKAQM